MPTQNSEVEKQIIDELDRYSIQGRSRPSPWDSSAAPGVGPGLTENLFLGSMLLTLGQVADEIIPWSYYPMRRDRQLGRLWMSEGIMSGAVYSMSARIGALPANVTGKPRAKQRAQELIHNLDVQRLVIDLLTTDNGFFIERVGPGRPDRPLNKNLIKQLAAMDSKQCWRTFDPEFPVIYVNPYTGAYHKMHYTRVITGSSCTMPEELARGIGYCAVSRALRYVQIMRDIATYKHEKISGRFKRAVALAKGFTPKTVKETFEASDLAMDAQGLTRYSMIPWLITQNGDADIKLTDLASLPDGFDTKTDTDIYVFALALAFGTDAREFWPSTGSGATKADATVQHEKSRGKGIGDIIQTLERALNWGAMPDGCEVEYDYTDDAEQMAEAQYHTVVITNVGLLQTQGNITPDQGNKILIAKGILDPEVVNDGDNSIPATDQTPFDPTLGMIDAAGNPLQPGAPGMPPGKPGQPGQSGKPTIPDQNLKPTPGRKPTMKTSDVEEEKEVKKKPTIAGFMTLTDEYQEDLEALIEDFIDEGMPGGDEELSRRTDDLMQRFQDLLKTGLLGAFALGLGGKQPSQDAIERLQGIASDAVDYFKGFINDLRSAINTAGESDTIQDIAGGFVSRIGLYAGDAWHTIWVGVGDSAGQSDQPLRVRRVLDPQADHCATCPPKARIYRSFEEMESVAGIPGDGSDDCLSNCRCTIEIETSPGSGDFSDTFGSGPTSFTAPVYVYGNVD